VTKNQQFPSDNDSRLTSALRELGQHDAATPDHLTRQRHLASMRTARRSQGISRLIGVAAAVALIVGAFVTTQKTSPQPPSENNAVTELAPLKEVNNITPVPFNRTEQYLMLNVRAANASSVQKELTTLLGASPSVVQNNDSSTTFVVPDSVAKKLSNTTGITATIDSPMKATIDQSPVPSWGLDRIDATDVALDNKYSYYSTGTSSYVYVIDTGIYSGHSDLAGRVVSGYTAVADGNGTEDCNGHGTHVAGTIAGTNYGVAKSTRVVAVRVLDCTGSGFTSSVIAGINWVIQSHPGGAGIINLSLGGAANTELDNAVANATAAGLTVIVAAGNNGADACSYSPSRAPSAITIGAISSNDSVASYSNTGSCVDIYAPGSGITSDWIGSSTATNTISGTSMATPHVAGLAARLAQAYPGISNSQIVAKLSANVVSSPVPVSTFAESQPAPTATTVVDTTVPVVTSTVDPGVPSTTVAPGVPTTTIATPTTTIAPTPTTLPRKRGEDDDREKVQPVQTPRGFALAYGVVRGSTVLTASWLDNRVADTYRIECARNRRVWAEDETDTQSTAESIILIERTNVFPLPNGRSFAVVPLPPSWESHCWMTAMIGNSLSRRSNVALVPRAPRVPVTTTTVAPTTTTTTVKPTTTTSTTVAPTTTVVAPARVPVTTPKVTTSTVKPVVTVPPTTVKPTTTTSTTVKPTTTTSTTVKPTTTTSTTVKPTTTTSTTVKPTTTTSTTVKPSGIAKKNSED
jgi:subtilisin family serine protease